MAFVIRNVSIEQDINIHELFSGFLPIQRSTSQQLFDTLLQELQSLGLPLTNMRGQGYDNEAMIYADERQPSCEAWGLRRSCPDLKFWLCLTYSLDWCTWKAFDLLVDDSFPHSPLLCLHSSEYAGPVRVSFDDRSWCGGVGCALNGMVVNGPPYIGTIWEDFSS
ncbi:hypothetical protein AVEN_263890-1 [Araneus ventricosus]|uniref:DUF4371 domain-containing protein n=1 Tax=Araneus ventricosus TaxID=182803 RepID=A0A4Y2LF80_ARAVE|nr:hypothetical protein AVEN_263890-1 [Araneus ventricosus]